MENVIAYFILHKCPIKINIRIQILRGVFTLFDQKIDFFQFLKEFTFKNMSNFQAKTPTIHEVITSLSGRDANRILEQVKLSSVPSLHTGCV